MKALAILFLLACGIWYWHTNVQTPVASLTEDESDFYHYHVAARAVLNGQSPFLHPEFAYPPLIAFLLAPLGAMPYLPARWTFFLISQAALLLGAWITWRRLGRDLLAACIVAGVWAAGGAASESLSLGQIGPILVLLIALAPTHEASAIGLGFALKFIPGVLAFPALLRRDWRTVARICAVSAALVILPWIAVKYCLLGPSRPTHSDYWMGTPAVLNWSLPAAALRAMDLPLHGELPFAWRFGNYTPNIHLTPDQHLVSLSTAAIFLIAGLVIIVIGRPPKSFAMAALISLALAASPVCWSHYQIMQYPGIALLLYTALRARRWISAAAVLIFAALVYPIPVAILTAYYHRYGGWTAGAPMTLYIWTTIPALASFGLFFLGVSASRRLLPTSAPRDIPPVDPPSATRSDSPR